MRSAHEVLGVGRDATEAQIRSAYRRLARQHHPDMGGNPDSFAAVQRAYNELCPKPAHEHARSGPVQSDQFVVNLTEHVEPVLYEALDYARRRVDRTIDSVGTGFLADLFKGAARRVADDLGAEAKRTIAEGMRNARREAGGAKSEAT